MFFSCVVAMLSIFSVGICNVYGPAILNSFVPFFFFFIIFFFDSDDLMGCLISSFYFPFFSEYFPYYLI